MSQPISIDTINRPKLKELCRAALAALQQLLTEIEHPSLDRAQEYALWLSQQPVHAQVEEQRHREVVSTATQQARRPEAEQGELLAQGEQRCPDCGAGMRQRYSQFGHFLGCERYPECHGTRQMPGQRRFNTRKGAMSQS